MAYTCQNCGAKSIHAHKLCNATDESPEDNFCGIPEEWICSTMLPKMKFACESCGSVAATPKNLCRPEEIE